MPLDAALRASHAGSAGDGFAAGPKSCFGRWSAQPAGSGRPGLDRASVADGEPGRTLVDHHRQAMVVGRDGTADAVVPVRASTMVASRPDTAAVLVAACRRCGMAGGMVDRPGTWMGESLDRRV